MMEAVDEDLSSYSCRTLGAVSGWPTGTLPYPPRYSPVQTRLGRGRVERRPPPAPPAARLSWGTPQGWGRVEYSFINFPSFEPIAKVVGTRAAAPTTAAPGKDPKGIIGMKVKKHFPGPAGALALSRSMTSRGTTSSTRMATKRTCLARLRSSSSGSTRPTRSLHRELQVGLHVPL